MDNPEYENFLLKIADDVEVLVAVPKKRKRFAQHSRDLGKKQAICSQVRGGAKQMPPDPLLGFIPTSNGEPPPLKIDEALVTYYFLLATIHDKMRKEYIPINNDIWAKRLAESVWPIVENLYVDKQFIIKAALIHVKADLAEKPAGAEHENKDTKKKREGEIEPRPPEILQKILWILKHGRKHWKLVLLAILVLLICCILTLLK